MTDEQIAQLQQIARDETRKLNEGGAATTAARRAPRARAPKRKLKESLATKRPSGSRPGARALGGTTGNTGSAASASEGTLYQGHRIVVNAPVIAWTYFENGKLIKSTGSG